jgi:pentose-5-phosphate-3-epimerase
MKLIVPTITAKDAHQLRAQTELAASISEFAHLDLSSADFFQAAPSLNFSQIYFEPALTYSVHLMLLQPMEAVKFILQQNHPPKLIILQAESDPQDLKESIKLIKNGGVLLGVSLLQNSDPKEYSELLELADQALIFSGNLGQHGGSADLNLTSKIKTLKEINPELEIAWDGGINSKNISNLSLSGVEVFYVGGEIHNSPNPALKLSELQSLV